MSKGKPRGVVNPNPPHGTKGDFRRMTVTLPPAAYELLVHESAKRKIAGRPNHPVSAIVREAVVEYLGHRPALSRASKTA